MTKLDAVHTDRAPKAIGPYAQAVTVDGWVFCSGQIALDPATGELVQGDIEAQVERVLQNVMAILKEAKMGPEHVVKTTVYLADLADFPRMNEIYGRYLGKEPPARSTIQVAALPKGARVEIDVIAAF